MFNFISDLNSLLMPTLMNYNIYKILDKIISSWKLKGLLSSNTSFANIPKLTTFPSPYFNSYAAIRKLY